MLPFRRIREKYTVDIPVQQAKVLSPAQTQTHKHSIAGTKTASQAQMRIREAVLTG